MGNSPKKVEAMEDHVGMADFSSHGWILACSIYKNSLTWPWIGAIQYMKIIFFGSQR